jgi:hypothetical protein
VWATPVDGRAKALFMKVSMPPPPISGVFDASVIILNFPVLT